MPDVDRTTPTVSLVVRSASPKGFTARRRTIQGVGRCTALRNHANERSEITLARSAADAAGRWKPSPNDLRQRGDCAQHGEPAWLRTKGKLDTLGNGSATSISNQHYRTRW
jgi:hypothetical protein